MQNVCPSTIHKDFCPYCEDITESFLITKDETVSVLGKQIIYKAELYICRLCNKEFAPGDMEEKNIQTAYNVYRSKYNILTPKEIQGIRESYALSQADFSRFFGWDDVTIERYESGLLPDVTHNLMLILVKDAPVIMLKILKLNRNNLSDNIAKELENKIHKLLGKLKDNSFFYTSQAFITA